MRYGQENKQINYTDYLRLDSLLNCQHPHSAPTNHDETLFIIQHQTSELWFKLLIHELQKTNMSLVLMDGYQAIRTIERVNKIIKLLTESWSVIETMRPKDFLAFRHYLGSASGAQSFQYRAIEYLLGNRPENPPEGFPEDKYSDLRLILDSPSLYDNYLIYLAKNNFIDEKDITRSWHKPYISNPKVVQVLKRIYEHPDTMRDAYEIAEKMLDIEINFQQWRLKHMNTVMRYIGKKSGTGGSSGIVYLEKVSLTSFFPERRSVRNELT